MGVVVVQHAGVPVRALRVVQFEAVTPLWLRRRERGLRQVLLLRVAVSGVLLCGAGLPVRPLQLNRGAAPLCGLVLKTPALTARISLQS